MRVPKVDHFDNTSEIVTIGLDKPILIPRIPVITTDKQRVKLTKSIEKYIRKSLEYKDLIKYLKTYINMNECEFWSNFKGGKKRGFIEIHHAPFDLYTITSIVMRKHEAQIGYIDELMVADEVMRLHYEGLVGLIPLSVTAHELVHDGKLIVPLNCVYGRFVKFTQEYFEWIDDDTMSMLNENIELTKKLSRKDLSLLNVKYIYTKVDGFHLPEKIA